MVDGAPPLRVALIGWGAIARTVARLIEPDPISIVAVAVRDVSRAWTELPPDATVLFDPRHLAAQRPDIVVEAASQEAVAPWGRAALEVGADYVVSSVSAFADADTLESLRADARRSGAQVRISPGALAGVDALAAARVSGLDAVEHRIVKPPHAWAGTPAEELCDLGQLDECTVFYRATAAEVARRFPKNANAAMTTALAGVGPDATTITLVADPSAATNRHELAARGEFGRLDVTIDNAPLPDNPKTSAMAALSLVRALRNRTSPVVT